MADILSPEEQSVAPQESFDLVGALKAGHSKEDIASYLAEKKKFNIQGAKEEGYTDEQIISHLLGGGASKAFGVEFVRQLGSSAKGIGQILGVADDAQIRAEKEAADIYGALYPKTALAGSFAGAVGDPVALPATAIAPLKAATITGTLARQGAAQGALSGVLEPITKEGVDTGLFNWDRALNAIIGTAGGAAIGGGAGALIQRLTRKPEILAPKTAADEIADVLTGQPAKVADEAAPVVKAEETTIKTKEEQDLIDRLNKLKEDRLVLEEKIATGEPRPVTGELTPAQRMFAEGPERPSPLTGELSPTQKMFAEGPSVPRAVTGELTPMQRMFAEGPTTPRPITGGAQALTPMQRIALEGPQIEGMSAATKAAIDGPQLMPRPITGGASALTETQRMFLRGPQSPADIAKERLSKINEEIVNIENTLVRQAPLTPTQQTQITKIQKILDDNGFKTIDEAVAATAKTAEERAAAQARIDAGQTQTLEQLVRGFRSAGSAAVPPERLFAESYPFSSAPVAAIRATTETPVKGEGVFAKTKIEPVSHAETNDVLKQAVNFLDSKELKEMREGGKFSGTLKGTVDAGIAAARKAAQEEGSYLGWLFKEDDKGNFVNIDKSWNRGEIAAFMPIVRDASNIYKRLMDEAVNINMNGKLSDAALQDVMERMAYPIQIMGIFQAKRTQASRSLNAFKTLNTELKEGKNVKGFMNAGKTC
ncbi:MAG: hypothetical protein ACO22M_00475 [Candidatus Nanopelagicaceae bacterium]